MQTIIYNGVNYFIQLNINEVCHHICNGMVLWDHANRCLMRGYWSKDYKSFRQSFKKIK